jgi:L-fuculose-phosphate aldolase
MEAARYHRGGRPGDQSARRAVRSTLVMATFIENAPEQVLAAAKELLEKGLVEGTSGNISARQEDGNIACTPSSLDYRIMQLEDIVIINPAGETVSGERNPTSEIKLHLACMNEFTVYLGGDVRCTEYAMSGSDELGEQTVKALEDRGAALIANHGMVAVATDMHKAMHITALVERSAKIIWGAKQLGAIHPLPEKVNKRFMGVYPYMR